MAAFVDRYSISLSLRPVDFTNDYLFVPDNHHYVDVLQPRVNNKQDREEQIDTILEDLKSTGKLKKLPWVMETPEGLLATISGYGRRAALKKAEMTEHVIVVDCTLREAHELAQLSNPRTAEDVWPVTEHDIIASYRQTALFFLEDKEWTASFTKEQEKELSSYLKEKISNHHIQFRSNHTRLGNIVNKIIENFRLNKQYLRPVALSEKSDERDKLIDAQYKEYFPKNSWDTSKPYSNVFQFFSSAETFANTKQSLDTVYEDQKNNDLYNGKKELHIVQWIKSKQGNVLKSTVDKKVESLLKDYRSLNINARRVNDYNIRPAKRLFIPSTFADYPSRCFEWDMQINDFVEKFKNQA